MNLYGFYRRLTSLCRIKISAKEGLTAFLRVPKDGLRLVAKEGETGIIVIENGEFWHLPASFEVHQWSSEPVNMKAYEGCPVEN